MSAIFGEHFPSTSHIATLPFLQRLTQLGDQQMRKVRAAWQRYIAVLQASAFLPQLEQIPASWPAHPLLERYDGSLLFEERLVDILYAPGSAMNRNPELLAAKQALRGFYQELDTQCGQKVRPDPYYALLQADGDGMGKVIDAQAAHGYQRHQALSHQLSLFSRKAMDLVLQHQGAIVYAGGDDILAFLPLHTVLDCAQELRASYRSSVAQFTNEEQKASTLSVGIGIVHHLDALRAARNAAEKAEKRAKQVPGKNALAMTISKRSGEDYTIEGPGEQLEAELGQLIAFCQMAALPTGTAYELRELVLRMGSRKRHGSSFVTSVLPQENRRAEVMQWDALRIIQRKLYVPRGKISEKVAQEAEQYFKRRFGMDQNNVPAPLTLEMEALLYEIINEVIIAQTLAHARQLAVPEKVTIRS